jgi:hypothetical protein
MANLENNARLPGGADGATPFPNGKGQRLFHKNVTACFGEQNNLVGVGAVRRCEQNGFHLILSNDLIQGTDCGDSVFFLEPIPSGFAG